MVNKITGLTYPLNFNDKTTHKNLYDSDDIIKNVIHQYSFGELIFYIADEYKYLK